jgi:AcrR family transcriptional regulator
MTKIVMKKQPLQSRAKASCDAILEATAQVLLADGLSKVTTNHIADRAGVSIGTLYQYFPSKEAILAELINQMRGDMLQDLSDAQQTSAGQPLGGVVEAFIIASLRHHERNPKLAELLERAEGVLPLEDRTQALKQQIHALVASTLAQHAVPTPEIAARDLSAMVSAMAEQAINAKETDFDAIAARCIRAAKGYLGV